MIEWRIWDLVDRVVDAIGLVLFWLMVGVALAIAFLVPVLLARAFLPPVPASGGWLIFFAVMIAIAIAGNRR